MASPVQALSEHLAALNQTPLHQKLGFARIGTLRAVGFKHGRWVDTVLMQRPLGEGSGTLPPA